mgnify:CR=1 FL=1
MTITNGYCTLDELKRELAIESLHVLDDDVLERIIEDSSRAVDNFCGRQFYAASASQAYSVPAYGDSALWLDSDWLSVSSITNGNGATIAASLYTLWPLNKPSKSAIRINDSANTYWTGTSGGDEFGVITVAGSTGYVNRAASDAQSARIISNTKRATLIIASAMYRKRSGQDTQAATVTAAGVVLAPVGMPKDAAELLVGYRVLP